MARRAPSSGHPHRPSRARGERRLGTSPRRADPTRLLAEVDDGAHAGPTGTFAALLDEWSRLKARSWSPKTELETARIIRLHLAPDRGVDERAWRATPGRLTLRQITTARLDQHYTALLTGGLAPPTVRRIHGVARAALEQAVRWGWLTRNPAAHAEPIGGRSAEITPPTTEDVGRLIAHVAAHDGELALFIRLAAVLGRRRGELCALRWTDIDLDAGTVRVARTPSDSIADGWVERPISKNPRRQPPLAVDAGTVALLRSHRVTVVEALVAATESSTVSALRRVGWMLDRFTDLDVSGLRGLATASAPTMLDPHGGRRGSIDADWGLIINSSVEPEA